jgi:hypothetical protein
MTPVQSRLATAAAPPELLLRITYANRHTKGISKVIFFIGVFVVF